MNKIMRQAIRQAWQQQPQRDSANHVLYFALRTVSDVGYLVKLQEAFPPIKTERKLQSRGGDPYSGLNLATQRAQRRIRAILKVREAGKETWVEERPLKELGPFRPILERMTTEDLEKLLTRLQASSK